MALKVFIFKWLAGVKISIMPKKSKVWLHFVKVDLNMAKCNICAKNVGWEYKKFHLGGNPDLNYQQKWKVKVSFWNCNVFLLLFNLVFKHLVSIKRQSRSEIEITESNLALHQV